MYVGNRHTATVEKLVPLDFACKECGLEQLAIVVSWGEGQGNSAFFLDESGAKGRAASSAGEAADKNARKMLALARCPQCFAQDESALRSHRMNRWLLVLAVIVGCGLFGALLAALIEPAWGYGIAIFSGAFGLWAGWVQMSAIEQGAANRVVFPSADGEDEQDDAAEDRQEWNLEGLDLADEQEGEDSGEDDEDSGADEEDSGEDEDDFKDEDQDENEDQDDFEDEDQDDFEDEDDLEDEDEDDLEDENDDDFGDENDDDFGDENDDDFGDENDDED